MNFSQIHKRFNDLSILKVVIMMLRYPISEVGTIRCAISGILKRILNRFLVYVQTKHKIAQLQRQLLKVKSYAEWDEITKQIDVLHKK